MPSDPSIPSHPASPLPPLIRKDGDREPPKDQTVGTGVTPVVNGTPRGDGGGEKP